MPKRPKPYDHKAIEPKLTKEWDKKKLYTAKTGAPNKTFYGLVEFPFPSGAGLHTGHVRSYVAMDIVARKRRMQGYNVLYPMGWDAFGLPTENYAIKTGMSPQKVTKENTDTFRRQLKSLGLSFDWTREVNTTDPAYYKWTQWIFLQMYKKGLAYKTKTTINWCPKDKIGLANEEVVNGCCERCGTPTEKKEKEQWMLAITKYADRLDKDLDSVNYLEKIKIQQRNWIGKSEGGEIEFTLGSGDRVKVFTTRADTLFGVTYIVLAPEHALVKQLLPRIKNKDEVEAYIRSVKNKTDIERTAEDKEKTGIQLQGIFATNPGNGMSVPVWIADYVLAGYGTGAVMAVPAHDERDHQFAKKHNLPIKPVVEESFTEEGKYGNGIKPDLPFIKRTAVAAIIRNPKDNTYLTTDWKGFVMHGLVTGGVEEGEDLVESAIREIHEETGYKNLKLVRNPEITLNSFFYHRVKQQNRHASFKFLVFDLVDESRDEIDEKESAIHSIVWKTLPELKKEYFTVIEGIRSIDLIENPNYIFTGDGILANSGAFDGMTSEEARKKIAKAVGGTMVTKYKLRDWVFSRQRYWGEPIPMIRCSDCGWVPVPEKELPVKLPPVKKYEPTDNGESPLATISSWVNTKCPKCKGKAQRETDTMPNWAGSSWYFLRYTDPKNKKEFAGEKAIKYWMKKGVDWYNGGMEHTTLHLLYSRFWHKFLYDLKLVPTSEPYMKRTSHGMILAEGGEKMSKSKGNTVNPDEIVKTYGADTLRLYEMFMGPFDQSVSWSTASIIGPRRFIERLWKLKEKVSNNAKTPEAVAVTLHKTIKKVGDDIESTGFNTTVSACMIVLNEMEKAESISAKDFKVFLQILCPIIPYVADELWKGLGEKKSIHLSVWPKFDPKKLVNDTIKIAVQINGKVRTELVISADMEDEEVKAMALKDKAIIPWIENKEIKRVIYVPARLVNIVL